MVLRSPERVVVHLEHEVLDEPQDLGVVQPSGPAVGFVEGQQQLVEPVGRAGVAVAFDVDRLVGQPDQLQRLAERLGRLVGDLGADPGHLAQLGRAARLVAAFRLVLQELGVAAGPGVQPLERLLRGCEERQLVGIALVLAPRLHLVPQPADSDPQQFPITGAEMPLVGKELVVGTHGREFRMVLDRRLAQDLGAVMAPQILVLPIVADLLRHSPVEMTSAVGPFADVDAVLADAQFDHHRHRPGGFADRAGQSIVRAEVQRYGLEVLAQGRRLADDPGLALGLTKHLGEGLCPMQGDAHRRLDDLAPQRGRLRCQVGQARVARG